MIYEKKLATMSINLIWTNDVNADDSDCEEVQSPEFDPKYESEDDDECDLPSETEQLYTD